MWPGEAERQPAEHEQARIGHADAPRDLEQERDRHRDRENRAQHIHRLAILRTAGRDALHGPHRTAPDLTPGARERDPRLQGELGQDQIVLVDSQIGERA